MHFYVTLISVILTGCFNAQLSLQFEINVIIPVQNSVMTTTIPCVDALSNCDVFNYTRICDRDGIYATWAKQNCRAYCGYCTVMTTTVPCVDALQNCDVYNYTRICDRDGIYATWAKQNCGAYCGHCTNLQANASTVPDPGATNSFTVDTSIVQTTASNLPDPGATNTFTVDMSIMTTTIPCVDVLPNCDEYQNDLCDNNLYRLFRNKNCRRFCIICTGDFDHLPLTPSPSPSS
uniref:ShKT domain-containing protein n=1 Tax=Magallana gigas TaxID=29159 RepID=A0A8W8IXA3_MAGGI